MPTWPMSEFHWLFDSGFAPSALSLRLNSWSHAWHDADGGNAVYIFCVIVFWTKGRLLPIFTCIFCLSATYFGIFARRALVRSRTPMILCLSNARSGYLHFGISFVALRALVREIIPNAIHTHPPTYSYIHDLTRISIDCLTPASRLRRSASVWMSIRLIYRITLT